VAEILRGEIRWADLTGGQGHEQAGARPVLVISHGAFNQRSGTAIVLAITSTPQNAGYPLTMPVKSVPMPKPSWVKLSQVRTLATSRLRESLGRMSEEEVLEAVRGLVRIVG
jgi:mRNA interferase MazF